MVPKDLYQAEDVLEYMEYCFVHSDVGWGACMLKGLIRAAQASGNHQAPVAHS